MYAGRHFLDTDEKKMLLFRKGMPFIVCIVLTAICGGAATVWIYSRTLSGKEAGYAKGILFALAILGIGLLFGALAALLDYKIYKGKIESGMMYQNVIVTGVRFHKGFHGRSPSNASFRAYYTCRNEMGFPVVYECDRDYGLRSGDRALILYYMPPENIMVCKTPHVIPYKLRH